MDKKTAYTWNRIAAITAALTVVQSIVLGVAAIARGAAGALDITGFLLGTALGVILTIGVFRMNVLFAVSLLLLSIITLISPLLASLIGELPAGIGAGVPSGAAGYAAQIAVTIIFAIGVYATWTWISIDSAERRDAEERSAS